MKSTVVWNLSDPTPRNMHVGFASATPLDSAAVHRTSPASDTYMCEPKWIDDPVPGSEK
jgi:hypothetical protein